MFLTRELKRGATLLVLARRVGRPRLAVGVEENHPIFVSSLEIRPFRPTDLDALYRICRLTGWRGGDATEHYSDPLLLGHYYAAPYVKQDPGLCLVATLAGEPAGYVLGTADSAGFRAWSELHWFPPLRAKYALREPADTSPEAALVRRIHAGYEPPNYAAKYPAHLHIDLLPQLQGQGVGARLMNRFIELLRARSCPAVHLVVNSANTRAVRFYEKFGFHVIEASPNHRAYGLRLL